MLPLSHQIHITYLFITSHSPSVTVSSMSHYYIECVGQSQIACHQRGRARLGPSGPGAQFLQAIRRHALDLGGKSRLFSFMQFLFIHSFIVTIVSSFMTITLAVLLAYLPTSNSISLRANLTQIVRSVVFLRGRIE